MDINTVRGLITAVLLVAFVALFFWAWSHKRKEDFDEAAQIPLSDKPKNVKRDAS